MKFKTNFKKVIISTLLIANIGVFASNAENNGAIEDASALNVSQWANQNPVVFQGYSLYQPYSENTYSTISAEKAQEFGKMGITDWWFAPPFRNYGLSRYSEGYAVSDRYDLGEFPQGRNGSLSTKYGNRSELTAAQNNLKANGIRPMLDIVPWHNIGQTQREAVQVRNQANTSLSGLMTLYTKGDGQGQIKYGNQIKNFNQNHFVGTASHNQGFRILQTGTTYHKYFGANNAANNLPQELQNVAGFKIGLDKVSGLVDNYVTVDSWVCYQNCADQMAQKWVPVLALWNGPNKTNYYNAMRAVGITDPLNYADSGKLGQETQKFIDSTYNMSKQEQPQAVDTWVGGSMAYWLFNGKTSNPNTNASLAVGLAYDYGRQDVKDETKSWIRWLVDNSGFTSFRIDGRKGFNPEIGQYIVDYAGQKLPGAPVLSEEWGNGNTQYVTMPSHTPILLNPGANITDTVSRLNTLSPQYFTFASHHDAERYRVEDAQIQLYGQAAANRGEFISESFNAYYNDRFYSVDKKYDGTDPEKQYNILSNYALMLSQANIVPNVFYGDMYRSDREYMSELTPIGTNIQNILKARKTNAYGTETNTAYGTDTMSTVRPGTTKDQGMVTVVSNNPTVNKAVKINFGTAHAGQKLKDVTGTHTESLVVDASGYVTINVKGKNTATLKGDLAVLIPDTTTVTPPVVGPETIDTIMPNPTTDVNGIGGWYDNDLNSVHDIIIENASVYLGTGGYATNKSTLQKVKVTPGKEYTLNYKYNRSGTEEAIIGGTTQILDANKAVTQSQSVQTNTHVTPKSYEIKFTPQSEYIYIKLTNTLDAPSADSMWFDFKLSSSTPVVTPPTVTTNPTFINTATTNVNGLDGWYDNDLNSLKDRSIQDGNVYLGGGGSTVNTSTIQRLKVTPGIPYVLNYKYSRHGTQAVTVSGVTKVLNANKAVIQAQNVSQNTHLSGALYTMSFTSPTEYIYVQLTNTADAASADSMWYDFSLVEKTTKAITNNDVSSEVIPTPSSNTSGIGGWYDNDLTSTKGVVINNGVYLGTAGNLTNQATIQKIKVTAGKEYGLTYGFLRNGTENIAVSGTTEILDANKNLIHSQNVTSSSNTTEIKYSKKFTPTTEYIYIQLKNTKDGASADSQWNNVQLR